jgi:predicted TPR repeat methyltransferase
LTAVPLSTSLPPMSRNAHRGPKRASADGERLAAALQLHQSGDAKDAAKVYRLLLLRNPNNADALHFLGVAEHQLGEDDKALKHITRALDLRPGHPDMWNNRGNIHKEMGSLDEAAADYRRALDLRPDDLHALNNLGTIARRRGDLQAAEQNFRALLVRKPDYAAAWQNLGNVLADQDRLHESLDAHREAMRLAPQSRNSYRPLGALLATVGRVEEAADVYRRWLELFPDDAQAKHYLAACTGTAVPGRAADDCVRVEFDDFAKTFDVTLARLEYKAPTLVDEELSRILGAPTPTLDVLDAGCGTGLCGSFLRLRARSLIGVDLSPGMIDLARPRELYDELVVEELTAYLCAHEAASDLIVSADTLVYFGDLAAVSRAMAKALRPGGHVVFTVELARDAANGFHLQPHGRYSHTADYVRVQLVEAGFSDPSLREVALRKEAGAWVEGYLVSAQKA